MKFIAVQRRVSIAFRPRCPAGALAGDIFEADAIDRTHRHTQLAAGAVWLDDGMHHFAATNDCVCRANRQAQGAANAPRLVNHGHTARCFDTVRRVQSQGRLPGDGSESGNADGPARWALVDRCSACRNGVCIGCAVRVAAACALGLWQHRVDATGHAGHEYQVRGFHPVIVGLFAASGFDGSAAGIRFGYGFHRWFDCQFR